MHICPKSLPFPIPERETPCKTRRRHWVASTSVSQNAFGMVPPVKTMPMMPFGMVYDWIYHSAGNINDHPPSSRFRANEHLYDQEYVKHQPIYRRAFSIFFQVKKCQGFRDLVKQGDDPKWSEDPNIPVVKATLYFW